MKKTFSVLLTVSILFGMMPSTFASDETRYEIEGSVRVINLSMTKTYAAHIII